MANIIKRVWNQNRMVQIEDLRGMTFQAEAAGHTFQISGIDDDGNTVALTGTPSGVLLRPDNTDVALTCSVSGGVVSATLPANCYDVPGRFGLTIFITSGSSKTAIYAAVGTVTRTSSGTVAPGTSQSVVDLINAINAAVNSIPASYSALLADIAPTYSNSALYSVGQYAWYDGDLKRCIVPITTAESYTAAHWTSAVLGQDVSDLKSALKQEQRNTVTLLSSDFEQGNFQQSGGTASATNRIRSKGFIPVYSGMKIVLKGGTNAQEIFFGKFNEEKTFIEYGSGWETNTTITVNWDGFIIFACRRTNGNDIAPSDYDATITFNTITKQEIDSINGIINSKVFPMIEEEKHTVGEPDDYKTTNLSVSSELIQGKYINTSGAIIDAPDNTYWITPYIYIGTIDKLYTNKFNTGNRLLGCYDENKVFLDYVSRDHLAEDTDNYRILNLPFGTRYVIATTRTVWLSSFVLAKYFWPGDSVVAGTYVTRTPVTFLGDITKRIADANDKTEYDEQFVTEEILRKIGTFTSGSSSDYGISWTWAGMKCTVTSSSTQADRHTFSQMYQNASGFPDCIVPGKRYKALIESSSDKIGLCIVYTMPGSAQSVQYITENEKNIDIPKEATGISIRLFNETGFSGSATITVGILTALTSHSMTCAADDYRNERQTIKEYGTYMFGYPHIAFPSYTVHNGIEFCVAGASTGHATQQDPTTWGGALMFKKEKNIWKPKKLVRASDYTGANTADLADNHLLSTGEGLLMVSYSTYYDNGTSKHDNIITLFDDDFNIIDYKVFTNVSYLYWGDPVLDPGNHLLILAYLSNKLVLHRSEQAFSDDISNMTFTETVLLNEQNITESSLGYFNNVLVCISRRNETTALLMKTSDLTGLSGWSEPVDLEMNLHCPRLAHHYNGNYLPFAAALITNTSQNRRLPVFGYLDIENMGVYSYGVIDGSLDSYSGYLDFVDFGNEDYKVIYYDEDSASQYNYWRQTALYYKAFNGTMYNPKMIQNNNMNEIQNSVKVENGFMYLMGHKIIFNNDGSVSWS